MVLTSWLNRQHLPLLTPLLTAEHPVIII